MKHILSLILALCLVLSLGLFPALAEGEGAEPVDPPVDTGEGGSCRAGGSCPARKPG